MSGDAKVSGEGRELPDPVELARAKGARGQAKGKNGEPGLSPAQKALRDSAIMASLHAGMEVREVAREFGLTPRSVQRIREAFELRPTALDRAPMQIIERVLRTYEQQMRDFMRVALDCIERAPAVAIAAMKGHADSLERYATLLSDVGKLPDNLELFRAESEMLRVGETMVDMLGRVERGELSAAEAADAVRGLLTSRAPLGNFDAESTALELGPGDLSG